MAMKKGFIFTMDAMIALSVMVMIILTIAFVRFETILPEKTYQKLLKQTQDLDKRISIINSAMSKDNKIVDILKIISNAVNDDIVLSSLEYQNPDLAKKNDNTGKTGVVVIIKGNVYKNFLSADITLLKFISALKAYQYFSAVRLIEEKKQINDKVFLFKIQLEM